MTAYLIRKQLQLKGLNYDNIEKQLNKLGYSIVFFNTPDGDVEIERYNLECEKANADSFTYSETAKIVFINAALPSEDVLYVLLHELGHIALGHIGKGDIIIKNKALMEIEADNFAYLVLNYRKSHLFNTFVIMLIFAIITIIGGYFVSSPAEKEFIYSKVTFAETEPNAESVFITPTGKKFHRPICGYLKNKDTLTELTRTEALNNYAPCSVCNP